MSELAEFGRLLLGTVIHRPYVYAFFACFLAFALRELGARRTALWTAMAWAIAWCSEYSATRNGFPFGIYTYIDETRTRELWISNVPFWDSLSFVFLAYFSRVLAAGALGRAAENGRGVDWRLAMLSGFLMMLLDVVIDPVTLLGDRWFLGRIYFYPTPGPWFGVTLENFAGWWFVGSVTQALFASACARLTWLGGAPRAQGPRFVWLAFGVYAGVFAFNLTVTALVAGPALLATSMAVAVVTLAGVARALRARGRRGSSADAGGGDVSSARKELACGC